MRARRRRILELRTYQSKYDPLRGTFAGVFIL
jgi:hypothetical protein